MLILLVKIIQAVYQDRSHLKHFSNTGGPRCVFFELSRQLNVGYKLPVKFSEYFRKKTIENNFVTITHYIYWLSGRSRGVGAALVKICSRMHQLEPLILKLLLRSRHTPGKRFMPQCGPDPNPDHPQNLIYFPLARNTPLVKMSCLFLIF